MNTPLKLVWKFDSCLDLNTPWIWTETWFKQASSWVKTKIWWWKCDYPAEISYIVDISLPEISCVFQMFTFVTSYCSPHISTSQQKNSTECLIWCRSGCVRILPFDRLRELCLSTVSKDRCVKEIPHDLSGEDGVKNHQPKIVVEEKG